MDATGSRVEAAASWYRQHMAWPVLATDTQVLLPLGRGMVAFELPAESAEQTLRQLDSGGCRTPVFTVAGRVVILADANDLVLARIDMPLNVRYLSAPTVLALPYGSHTSRWIRPPRPSDRWLCSAAAVHAALTPVWQAA